jgi:histidine triad (HIT) family protein
MPSATERTIFEKIVQREIPAHIVYQDDEVTAFRDVNPVAPIHILVAPNKPLRTLNNATAEDTHLLGKLLLTAQRLAHELGIADDGYRIVMNCNSQGGQSVYHLHFHLLGGRKMTWPPG